MSDRAIGDGMKKVIIRIVKSVLIFVIILIAYRAFFVNVARHGPPETRSAAQGVVDAMNSFGNASPKPVA